MRLREIKYLPKVTFLNIDRDRTKADLAGRPMIYQCYQSKWSLRREKGAFYAEERMAPKTSLSWDELVHRTTERKLESDCRQPLCLVKEQLVLQSAGKDRSLEIR